VKRVVATSASVAVAALLLASAGATRSIKEGGTYRTALPLGAVDSIDPALYNRVGSGILLRPAQGTLMAFPDKPLPEGFRLQPELAEADPVISKDGRTYTFQVRKDARFSTGARVTARAFARALERILDPGMRSPRAGDFQDIVGAKEVLAGRATTPRGVIAKGRTLIVRLERRLSDFPVRTSSLSAVPPSLEAHPEGPKAPLPSAAPYYVSEYVPNERLVLERNRFYRGTRPHHVDRFVADLAANALAVDLVAEGKLEQAAAPLVTPRAAELARRYGVNKSQFFVNQLPGIGMLVLNTSRPLFRNNPKLRQAVNFAVDRRALTREFPPYTFSSTDQYLSPGTPGYRDERIYQLGGDLRRARKLAAGRTRGGKAVFYTTSAPLDVALAQIVQRSLKRIGLEIEIKQFPTDITLLYQRLRTPAEPFDIGRVGWGNVSNDPDILEFLFHGRAIGRPDSGNLSYFDSRTFNRRFDRAARLSGEARNRAYGELDLLLARDAAPAVPYAVGNNLTFVSSKVGCITLNPYIDLTAVCLK
jgi:peptide/nickel transport system substrate-binding protein